MMGVSGMELIGREICSSLFWLYTNIIVHAHVPRGGLVIFQTMSCNLAYPGYIIANSLYSYSFTIYNSLIFLKS